MPYGGMTALVIDDDELTINLLKKCLSYIGFNNIICYTSPIMALDVLAMRKVDIIICDFEMTPINGLQFIRIVRAFAGHRNHDFLVINLDIPIIVVTGHAQKSIISAVIKAGANAVLVKPVRPSVLKAKIDTVLMAGQ